MKRLVYAPKAYVFIRSSNLDGKIFDVSSDVVRGSVTQNVGDLSKASFELRNRYQKWIRDKNTKESLFLPMDLVTIWLQRVSGKPIQVFTGYLDSVPYYQGYPGNATFTASCTLKKLAFTWFDPGLEFFQQWVQSTAGWFIDPATGEAMNVNLNVGHTSVDPSGLDTRAINDAGFAELLGRFMLEIAGWGPNDVLISELPKDLPKIAAKLYNNIHDSSVDADLTALSDFLGQAMGVPGYSTAGNTTDPSSTGNPPQAVQSAKTLDTMQRVADKNNVPVLVLAVAARLLSGMEERYNHAPSTGSNWGYGMYAMRPLGSIDPNFATNASESILGVQQKIEGYTIDQILSLDNATDAFCKRLLSVAGLSENEALVKAARDHNNQSQIISWIELASGRNVKANNIDSAFTASKAFVSSTAVIAPSNTPSSTIDPSDITFKDPRLVALMTPGEKDALKNYGGSRSWIAGLLWRAKQFDTSIELSSAKPNAADMIVLTCSNSAKITNFFNSLKGDDSIDSAIITVNGNTSSLSKGKTATWLNVNGLPNALVLTQKAKPSAPVPTSDPAQNTLSGGATFAQLAAYSANSAFAANFAFPSSRIESQFLTGNRALMNDVSCFDGVKQFCQASMRTFRSLPDGRFLAFYPDYFGVYRSPYWQIRDIEIVNMGIQLNDDALATHVYVIGDTFALDGKIDFLDKVSTRGVATITQSFMLDSIMMKYDANSTEDPNGDSSLSKVNRIKSAWEFLQHYGARPLAEEQPLIRNTAYEFLMAWQRFGQLWANTFATTVDFTFQPEVMSGGLIEFPDHNLQMYCENVTHTFDYESGFSTQATMTSPAHTDTGTDKTFMPGFALAGGINSVGAA